jgi:hypothetical protein
MKFSTTLLASAAVFAMPFSASAQMGQPTETVVNTVATPPADPVAPVSTAPAGVILLPADTIVQITPEAEITSKKMKEGDAAKFRTVNDVTQSGVIVIPRGSPVVGKIIWRTGKGIGGKSAKFEVEFVSVNVKGTTYVMKGKHRQEGRGNTVAALLGSMLITGKSAVMTQGQIVNAFTAQDISITT